MATEIQRNRRAPDSGLILAVAALLGIGIIMVFSASVVRASADAGDAFTFLKRQTLSAGIGLGAMFLLANINYWQWSRWSRVLLVAGIVMLVLVLIPGVGIVRNNARRWFGFGGLNFQPSEFMKFAFVIFLSDYLSRRRDAVHRLDRLLLPMAILGMVFVLIMLEPDLGTALAIAGTVFIMLFAGGIPLTWLTLLGSVGATGAVYYAFSEDYRRERIMTFLNPWRDPLGESYQVIQGLLALASGHIFGVGLGRSRQKFWYLPEPHTDYIFAIIGEELGFIGATVVILLFLLFAWRGYRIAAKAPDRFASLLVVGITTMIVLQAVMNIAVVTASIPATGIPLPLVSYGGSSLMVTLAGIGILLGVSRYTAR